MTESYPLAWPPGWPRTPASKRGKARFGAIPFARTRAELFNELKLMGVGDWNVVISSWLPLRRDGLPYADQARKVLEDPGVAVYFRLRDKQMVMARDAYDNPNDNLRSLFHAISHMRGMERHGGATMMERAFEGFAALPEPGNASHGRKWWQVLEFKEDPSSIKIGLAEKLLQCEGVYRQKAKSAHPDNGGSHAQMSELNAAIAQARQVLGVT